MQIKTLTEKSLNENWQAISRIDAVQMGDFEKWEKKHFKIALPLKFLLSVVAFEKKRAAGYAISSKKDDVAHIHRVAVHPDYVGQGIGSKMLEGLIERARKLKIKRVEVETLRESGIATFYQKNSFRKMTKKELEKYSKNREENLRKKTLEKSVVLYKNL